MEPGDGPDEANPEEENEREAERKPMFRQRKKMMAQPDGRDGKGKSDKKNKKWRHTSSGVGWLTEWHYEC
jgi:hypothetical protein